MEIMGAFNNIKWTNCTSSRHRHSALDFYKLYLLSNPELSLNTTSAVVGIDTKMAVKTLPTPPQELNGTLLNNLMSIY